MYRCEKFSGNYKSIINYPPKEEYMSTNKLNDEIWKYWQKHLRYTDDEIELFKKDPRWEKIMSRAGGLLNKTIIFEVWSDPLKL